VVIDTSNYADQKHLEKLLPYDDLCDFLCSLQTNQKPYRDVSEKYTALRKRAAMGNLPNAERLDVNVPLQLIKSQLELSGFHVKVGG